MSTAERPARRRTESSTGARPQARAEPGHNRVELTGVLTRAPTERTLADGQTVTTFVLAVRAEETGPIDAIDCVARSAGLAARVLARPPGELLSVEGRLRRRFWTGSSGLVSRYEVEVERVARRAVAARARRPA